VVLVTLAYTYLASAFIGMAINRFRHRDGRQAEEGPLDAPAPPARDSEPLRKI
jgi:hypothetical protein